MPKHYKIANIPEYLTHEMAIEVQNKLNSGYTLEFKSDFKDGSIWVLSKMVTWDEFTREVDDELRISEREIIKLESLSEQFKQDIEASKSKWYNSPLFDEVLRAAIYVIAGIFFGHILTIL